MGRQGSGRLGVALLVVAAIATPRVARAQDGFLLGVPHVTLTVRGGYADAQARGDLFGFTTQQLTLRRRDFAGATVGADLVTLSQSGRFGWMFGVQYASSSAPSEFRDWVGSDDQPIAQTTKFVRVPLTTGLRLNLVSPGRSIGTLAWVPARIVPWVGGGVGATWYRFRQQGEFIDTQADAPEVFTDDFESSGLGLTGYGAGGFDYSVSPRMAVTVDARYLYGKATVGKDFTGFDKIDLSGLATTVGLTFRF